MYGPEHYMFKIQRNADALSTAPEGVKEECLAHIKWARELASRIERELIGYFEGRDQTIDHINEVLDADYVKMGYELPKKPHM